MDECIVRIDSLAAGGDGVGRGPDGRVLFVPFSAPGDRLRVRIERTHKRYAHGRVAEILEPGPGRVEPRCEVFGRCGGCTWQHIDYTLALEAKAGILRDALKRIGGLESLEEPVIHPSPEAYGYRGRTRIRVEAGRVGYRQRRSNALCAVDHCPILVPSLDAKLAALATNPPVRTGDWELAAAGADVRATPVGEISGAPLVLKVGGECVSYSAGVFAQSNALLLERLTMAVVDSAGEGTEAFELYAGAGLFTLPLARRFGAVVAVEGDPVAVGDLRANLAAASLRNVEVRAEGVAVALRALEASAPHTLVLDPPRTGLPPGGAALLGAVAASRIVYLSCDPATLARDLRTLLPAGYRLVHVEGFDLFPQTPHVEALATLDRE